MQRSPLKSVAIVIDGERDELDADQLAKLNNWLAEIVGKIDEKHQKGTLQAALSERAKSRGQVYAGVIGGNLTFSFTPTGLGTVVKVSEAITGDSIDLSDYDKW